MSQHLHWTKQLKREPRQPLKGSRFSFDVLRHLFDILRHLIRSSATGLPPPIPSASPTCFWSMQTRDSFAAVSARGLPPDRLSVYVEVIQAAWGTGAVTETLARSMVQGDEVRLRWARAERLSGAPDRIAIPRAFMESDVTDVVSAIQAPTLLISRQGDRHVRPEHSRFLATRISGAKLVELSGDDNCLFAGRADEIIDKAQEFITGDRPGPLLDRVLATVMFTDIVGSTTTAAELGDRRWNDLLTMHNEIVRKELERFRGREVDTVGDGFLALFDGPSRAIQCGLAVRDRLRGLGIDIRAGLHTGEIVSEGDDVRGIAVHVGARVAAFGRRL